MGKRGSSEEERLGGGLEGRAGYSVVGECVQVETGLQTVPSNLPEER